jgi:hypothetical protein
MSRITSAGYHFADVRERGGDDPRDLLHAVAEGPGITIGPLSLRTAAGDLGTLVTARPLDPPQSMPDTVLAWRANPSAHLRDTLALIQGLAARLRDEATAIPAPPTPRPSLNAAVDLRRRWSYAARRDFVVDTGCS